MELGCAAPMRLDAITILINTYNRTLAGVVDLRRQQAYRFNGEDSLIIRGEIRTMPLVEGAYGIGIYVRTENQEETVANVTTLDVLSKATQGQIAPYPPEVRGVVELDATFAVAHGH